MTGVITSLPPLVEQPPGSNASNPAGLPGVVYTAAVPTLAQTWTGLQTFTNGSVQFAGSTSGNTFLNATAIASGTLTLPAATDTLVARNTTDTLTNKTLTSPAITGATITTSTLNGNTWTAGTGTLTLGAGKTVTINNTLTFTGTDSSSVAFGAGGTVAYTGTGLAQFAATTSAQLAGIISDETGTGALVFGSSPTLITPALGTPTALTLTNATGLPLSGLVTQSAYTIVANNSGSAAAPTAMDVTGLTAKPSPAAADIVLIQDSAASNAFKRTTVGALASAGSVASIAGNTGAFTLAGGVTNSVNQIQHDGNYSGWALMNCTLAASVASNILTVALKDNTGADPSATSPAMINYRNVTAGTGSTTLVQQTAALSITTNAVGATLGSSSATAFRFWVVVFNNAGTNVLALINCSTSSSTASQIFPLNESLAASSTPMSAAATSAGVFYTPNGTTVTSKAFRVLGFIEYNSTGLVTAGTYATAPNFIQTFGPGIKKPGEIVQTVQASFAGTSSTSTTSLTYVSTATTASIAPTSAANLVKATYFGILSASTGSGSGITGLFRGATQIGMNTQAYSSAGQAITSGGFSWYDLPNATSSTAYLVKVLTFSAASTVTWGTAGGAGNGPSAAGIFLEEVMG